MKNPINFRFDRPVFCSLLSKTLDAITCDVLYMSMNREIIV